MLVELKKLKPNPCREFAVDPIDEDSVAALAQSIKDNGFWGGVVLRQTDNGEIQIGAGHHRIDAAMKAGIKTADLFVGRFDDPAMIRIYATENATQRGNSSTAIAGSVASAIRFLVKAVMTGNLSGIPERSRRGLETTRGQLETDRGLGEPIITEFLDGIPGIKKNSVTEQLANLKASGDYSRIVKEVGEEIERENREALKALAKAEKEEAEAKAAAEKIEIERKEIAKRAKAARDEAAAKKIELDRQRAEAMAQLAEKRRKEADAKMKEFEALRATRDTSAKATAKADAHEKTFDQGVARYLKNPEQVKAFRDAVEGAGVKSYLPVSAHTRLAKALVDKGKKDGRGEGELKSITATYIRDNITNLVIHEKTFERRTSAKERADLERKDIANKVEHAFEDAARNLRSAASAMANLKWLIGKHHLKTVKVPGEFRTAMDAWAKASAHFEKYW